MVIIRSSQLLHQLAAVRADLTNKMARMAVLAAVAVDLELLVKSVAQARRIKVTTVETTFRKRASVQLRAAAVLAL
jgi:hypothetical protein